MNNEEVLERVKAAKIAAIPSRLNKGAAVLGRLWRSGERCRSGWSTACNCSPRSNFCEAKGRWTPLAIEYHGGLPFGIQDGDPFSIIEMMTKRQFESMNITILVELPGGTKVKVGAGGATLDLIPQLASLQDDPEALSEAVRSVQLIQGVFA